jgi:hypothetical protein
MLDETRHNLLLDFCITLLLCHYLNRHPLGEAGISKEERLIESQSTCRQV